MSHRPRHLPASLAAALLLASVSGSVPVSAGAVRTPAPSHGAQASVAAPPAGTAPAPTPSIRVVNRTAFLPATVRTATGAAAYAPVTAPPRLRARAWAVADMETGRILGTHRYRERLPQASTIKLLTAVTAAETVAAHPLHRVTWAEKRPQYCSCAGLQVGRRYTRTTLLAGMLLPSGNDAAEALAGSHPRGRSAFVAEMNAEAGRLGASDTHVVTPSGLTAAGAYSSARDLLVFLRAAQHSPVVEPILNLTSYRFGPVGGRTHRVYRSTDYVNEYYRLHPGTQGKGGYTTPAKNTLVVVTPIKGHRIGVATLGAPSGYSTKGARALSLWAARNFPSLRAVGMLPPVK
jgi:D-alanyl-D-alanine carboxypeptidase (penicillin-binding protein 5/6)